MYRLYFKVSDAAENKKSVLKIEFLHKLSGKY